MINIKHNITAGKIRPHTKVVHAVFFDGSVSSIMAIEIFSKVKTHDTYASSAGDSGVMYSTTHLRLPIPGCTDQFRDVALYPGVYLVRCSDGGYFTIPAAAFHEIYGPNMEGESDV